MRIFKIKSFTRFARRQKISNAALAEAVDRAGKGLVDADLGGGLIKQRIARPGPGRSGGFRAVIAYRAGKLAVFLYGFAKNELDNIQDDELEALQEIAEVWFKADRAVLKKQVSTGLAEEITK